MKPGPVPKGSKDTWYVSFEPKERVGKRSQARAIETFRNKLDARAFARAGLAEGSNVNAGTLNPHSSFRDRDRRAHDLVKNPSPFGALSHIERLR
jgi:hypothetical protein